VAGTNAEFEWNRLAIFAATPALVGLVWAIFDEGGRGPAIGLVIFFGFITLCLILGARLHRPED
jgi:hypothetical protein